MSDAVILHDDPRACQKSTKEIFISARGRIFFYFYSARYDGKTHNVCECGILCEKSYYSCGDCIRKMAHENYLKKPFKEWDGITPVYSESFEQYFFDIDEIICYLENEFHGVSDEPDLMLVLCEPNMPDLAIDDDFCDYMPEDMSLEDVASQEFLDAYDNLNKLLKKEKPWSWLPGEYRTEIKKGVDYE